MSKIRSIKNDQDYREALELLDALIELDPAEDTDESDQLEVLSVLIEKYEKEKYPHDLPNAIEAIEFFMDQKDLKPVDLVPFLGSKSRVSEILSGKRNLTVDMIRALEENLGIPSKLLLTKPSPTELSLVEEWDNKLFLEMQKRGYFSDIKATAGDKFNQLKEFLSSAPAGMSAPSLLKQSTYRTFPITDKNALLAWSIRVLIQAKKLVDSIVPYSPGSVTKKYIHDIAKLSRYDDGPLRAVKDLETKGIIVIIEPHLPKTRLDGAVLDLDGRPVIGITLRHDRLDNFWFTLIHELAHVSLHFDDHDIETYFDELDKVKGVELDQREIDADSLASEALVPSDIWVISPANLIPSPLAAKSLANEIGVDVSIIAGKIRYENGNWSYLNKIIAEKTVRHMFNRGGVINE